MEPTSGTTHFGRLLERIRAGDPTAKDQLINDAYRRVHDLAHFILNGQFRDARRGIETDDVVSETFAKFTVRLHEGLARVPDNPAEMFGYAAKIIRHVVLDEVRKRAGPQFRTQFPAGEVPPDQRDGRADGLSNGVLERLAMQEAVARRSDDERKLIDLKFVWGLNDDEMAAELGCDPSTVRRRMRKLLKRLRDELEPPERDGSP
jgi:RNA polymerase sigma factor (sigma-70 family)